MYVYMFYIYMYICLYMYIYIYLHMYICIERGMYIHTKGATGQALHVTSGGRSGPVNVFGVSEAFANTGDLRAPEDHVKNLY